MTLPFENDTTEIIRKIVSAQLKHDKLKKYLSIFAISLATFLMTAVLLLVSGIIEVNTMVETVLQVLIMPLFLVLQNNNMKNCLRMNE